MGRIEGARAGYGDATTGALLERGESFGSPLARLDRVTFEIPHPSSREQETSLSIHDQIRAALINSKGPVDMYLLRKPGENEKMQLIIQGEGFVSRKAKDSRRRLKVPRRSRITVVKPDELSRNLNKFQVWGQVRREDEVVIPMPEGAKDLRLGLAELMHDNKEPFVIHIHAERVDPSVVKAKFTTADMEAGVVNRNAKQYSEEEVQSVNAHRTELDKARLLGFWEASISVGAMDQENMSDITETVAGQATLAVPQYCKFDAVPTPQQQPFFTSVDGLTALFDNIPRREVSGITVAWEMPFAVNHEMVAYPGEKLINLGSIYDGDGDLLVPAHVLEQHVGIFGKTQSGKSKVVDNILTQLAHPFTIIDPGETSSNHELVLPPRLAAKDQLPDELKKLTYIPLLARAEVAQGEPNEVPVYVNIFKEYPGTQLVEHISNLHQILVNAVGIIEGGEKSPDTAETQRLFSKFVLDALLGAKYFDGKGNEIYVPGVYEDCGFDMDFGKAPYPEAGKPVYPTITQLREKIDEVIDVARYDPSIKGNVAGTVDSEYNKIFSRIAEQVLGEDDGYELQPEEMLKGNKVISIGRVGNPNTRAVLMGSLLLMTQEGVRVKKERRVLVAEEIQDYLHQGSPLVATFSESFRKDSKDKITWIAVSQNPGKLSDEILEATDLRIVGKLGGKNSLDTLVDAKVFYDGQRDQVAALEPGEIVVKGANMHAAIRSQTHHPDDQKFFPSDPTASYLDATRDVDLGPDDKPYSRETIVLARRILDARDERARLLTSWAHFEAMAQLMQFKDVVPDREELEVMKAIPKDIRDRAIGVAVSAAIHSRQHAIGNAFVRADCIKELTKRMQSIVDNDGRVPAQRRDFSLGSVQALSQEQRKEILQPYYFGKRGINSAIEMPPLAYAQKENNKQGEAWIKAMRSRTESFVFGPGEAEELVGMYAHLRKGLQMEIQRQEVGSV